jgi:hypothetical protein
MPKHKMPENWEPTAKTLAWCSANGYDAEAHLEYFRNYCEAGEIKYANFDAAFRNACIGDWGGVRRNKKGNGYVSNRDRERAETIAVLTGRTGTTYEAG